MKVKIIKTNPTHWATAYVGTIQEVRKEFHDSYEIDFRINGVHQTVGVLEKKCVEVLTE